MATVSDKVLRERARRIGEWLENEPDNPPETGPMPAAGLAFLCKIGGGHETVRRRIREAVDYGRTMLGMRLCANGEGYWLARNGSEWESFLESRRRSTVFRFVHDRRIREAVGERIGGQGKLFDVSPVEP